MKRMWTKQAVDENAVDAVKTAIESGEIEVASNNLIAILSGNATDWEDDQDYLTLTFEPEVTLDLGDDYAYYIKGSATGKDGADGILFMFECSMSGTRVQFCKQFNVSGDHNVQISPNAYIDDCVVGNNGLIEIGLGYDNGQLNDFTGAEITAYIFKPRAFI